MIEHSGSTFAIRREDAHRRRRSKLLQKNAPIVLGELINGKRAGQLQATPFCLSKKQLKRHVALLGMSGSGKSRLLTKLIVDTWIDMGMGVSFLDPHGDCADAILGTIIRLAEETGNSALLDRVHYLRPSYKVLFRYDPFRLPRLEENPT